MHERPLLTADKDHKFKSCHSDQKSGVVRFPIFLYFTGFFGILGVCTVSKSSAIFFAQNRLKIGYDDMLDHICHEKAIFHKGFRHFSIFILCKMTAVLCFENRRFRLRIAFVCGQIINFIVLDNQLHILRIQIRCIVFVCNLFPFGLSLYHFCDASLD